MVDAEQESSRDLSSFQLYLLLYNMSTKYQTFLLSVGGYSELQGSTAVFERLTKSPFAIDALASFPTYDATYVCMLFHNLLRTIYNHR